MARYDEEQSWQRPRRNDNDHERMRGIVGDRPGYGYGGSGGGHGLRGGRDEEHDDPRSGWQGGGRRSGEYDDWQQYGSGESPEHDSRGFGRAGTSGGRARGWYGAEDRTDGERYGGTGSYGESGRAGAGRRGYGGGMSGRRGMSRDYQDHVAGMPSGVGGGMTGKGPKGYKRSDDRIKEAVCDCLTDDPHLDATSLEVQVKDGEVTLTGTVDSREARRHAEDLIDRMSGVKHVQNNLRVQETDQAGKAATTRS